MEIYSVTRTTPNQPTTEEAFSLHPRIPSLPSSTRLGAVSKSWELPAVTWLVPTQTTSLSVLPILLQAASASEASRTTNPAREAACSVAHTSQVIRLLYHLMLRLEVCS